MSIVLDGTSGITTNSGTVVSTTDATLNGLTVGKGGGAVSTNTALGYQALTANTSGDRNVAVGYQSAVANTTGINTSVGYQSLATNTTGTENTAVGFLSLNKNTTGNYNSGLSDQALYNNTTGSYNVAVGMQALQANTTSSYNTAVGYQAGYSTSTTGGHNTFVGYQAGYTNTTADRSVYLGDNTGYAATGRANTYIGCDAGYVMTTGASNTIIGRYNGNQGGFDIRTASNFIVLSDGDGNPRVQVNGSGSITVPQTYNDTTASGANMFVNASGGYYRSTSALKYKQDIRNLEEMDISLLRPVRYKSKCESDDQTKDHLGLIADEAADAGFEELVTRGDTGEVEGFQYERLTVVLLKKLQTLDAEFKAYVATHP